MVCGENNICLLKFQISSFYLLSHSHFTICIVALLQFKMDVGNAVDKHLLIIISAIWSLFGAVETPPKWSACKAGAHLE